MEYIYHDDKKWIPFNEYEKLREKLIQTLEAHRRENCCCVDIVHGKKLADKCHCCQDIEEEIKEINQ